MIAVNSCEAKSTETPRSASTAASPRPYVLRRSTARAATPLGAAVGRSGAADSAMGNPFLASEQPYGTGRLAPMATVTLRPPLRERAGGQGDHELSGDTVGEVLLALEQQHERVVGWILDEHGRVRPHVCVFLDGERVREDAPVTASDRLVVLPSISGGSA